MKLYYVYTQRVCAELMLKGHKLLNIEPSKKREGYNVFVFRETGILRKDVEELMGGKSKVDRVTAKK